MRRLGRMLLQGLLVSTLLSAQLALAQTTYQFDLPPQPLADALRSVGRVTHTNVLFDPPLTDGLRAPALKGALSADQAFAKLLAGTSLRNKLLDDKTVTIVSRESAHAADSARTGALQTPSDQRNDATSFKEAGNKNSSQDFRLAQADQGTSLSRSPEEKQKDQTSKKKADQLEEVVVTGSRIPTVVGQQVMPVRSYTREDIEQSGQTTIADFLNNLPDVSTYSVSNGYGIGGMTTVQLHGLPAGTTLLLLNGRRVETSNAGSFDLSNIPVSAVERVEVLPVGASAIYGADALGGAVNIILRQNLNGFEANGTFNHAAGESDTNANVGWGRSWDQGAISLIGTYQDRGELRGSQRAVTSTTNIPADALSIGYLENGCSPGTIYSLNGQNLPGLSSPQAGIPAGIKGTPTIQQFVATEGKPSKCNVFRTIDLVPLTQQAGAVLSAHYRASESIDLFSEVILSHERVRYFQDDLIHAHSYDGLTLGARNPYNPFGEAVGVDFDYPGIQTGGDVTETLIRPLIGVRGSFFSDWHYEITAYRSRDDFQGDDGGSNTSALQTALNSPDPNSSLNPFTTSAPGTPQLLQSLIASATPGAQGAVNLHYHYVDSISEGQVVFRGPLTDLPAGPLETVVGSEYGQEKQFTVNPNSPAVDLGRKTFAVFTEARVPLLDDRKNPKTGARLTLTLAGRYDHTDDFGGKATWQGGLLWRPTESILLRGGYGLSYRAPQLYEIEGGVQFSFMSNLGLVDPLRGGQSVSSNPLITFASNAKLHPETADSRTLGIVYSSQAIRGLEGSLTYFDVNISNFIARPDFQQLVDFPSVFPGSVIRGPATPQDQQLGFPGPITQVNALYFNFGDVRTAGFDADLRYAIPTSIGEFTPSLAVTNIYKWQSALTPNSPLISYVSQLGGNPGWAPRWKGTAALSWKREPLSANLTGRYVGRYKDSQLNVPNSNELGDSWAVDINSRFDVGKAFAGNNSWLAGAYVAVGAINLFDRAPPFSYVYPSYDASEYDPRGRIVYTQVGVRW